MKKLILVLIAFLVLFPLVGCGKNQTQIQAEIDAAVKTAVEEARKSATDNTTAQLTAKWTENLSVERNLWAENLTIERGLWLKEKKNLDAQIGELQLAQKNSYHNPTSAEVKALPRPKNTGKNIPNLLNFAAIVEQQKIHYGIGSVETKLGWIYEVIVFNTTDAGRIIMDATSGREMKSSADYDWLISIVQGDTIKNIYLPAPLP